MPEYKLTYFDGRGIADPIRQILTVSGTPFKDVRLTEVPTPEQKEELQLEWGQLPQLDVDGQKKSQSYAIARYLAKKFNLAGKNEDEQFRCDELVEAVRDYFQKAVPLLMLAYQEAPELEEKKKTFVEVDSPAILKRFDDLLQRQGKTWLVGDSLTYADIYLAHFVTHYETLFKAELQNNFSAVSKLIAAVHNHPKLKKYFDERPKTLY